MKDHDGSDDIRHELFEDAPGERGGQDSSHSS